MAADVRDRVGRIRVRWVASLTGLAVVPLLVVALSVPYQLFVEAGLLASASRAAERVVSGRPAADVARRSNVRIRLLDGDDVSVVGRAAMSRWTNHVAWQFVDRSSRERVRSFDARRRGVGPNQVGRGCAIVADGSLLSCHVASHDERGRLVVAEAASIRTISTLYGHRAPLVAVVLHVLVFALALGVWLGRRTVRPIDRLRDAVRERTSADASTMPIPVEGADEVAELARDFNELLAALRAEREATLDFVFELAHELKTPVATIQQFADLARAVGEPRLDRPLQVLEASCSRMNVRIGELLELARASAGLPGTEREQVPLEDLLRRLVQTHAGREQVSLRTTPLTALASARYLEIAIRNVLDNACAHASSSVEVTLRRRGAEAVITIRDDGPGIDEEAREQVFDRFRTGRRGGTGLGLAMTRAVLRAHGGDARALSSTAGAAIELCLPVAATNRA